MAFYPKSYTYTRLFKMISSSDHLSLKTGATPSVNISKAGAAFGKASGAVSEVANGWYKIVLNATDTNTAGDLAFYCTGFGTDDTDFSDQVFDTTVTWIGANVVNSQASTPASLNNSCVQADVERWLNVAASADASSNLTAIATSAIIDAVWDEPTSLHQTAGTTGKALSSAGSAGDPWIASIPGSYTPGQAGYLVGTNLDSTVSSRASTTNITAGVITTVTSTINANVLQWRGTNAATPASAGIPDINVKNYNNQTATTDANNLPNVNTQDWAGARATSVLLQGVPRVDLETWLSVQPLSLSSQQVQAVVPASTIVASVTGAVGSVTGAVGSVTGAVGSVTGNVGGNVVGSVGSVTGAVGSVTGNVGGNVTGSVGSVVGAVGSVTGNVGGNVTGSVGSVATGVFINAAVKKNSALSNFPFLMTDSTNHAPATGRTVTVTRSIDGGVFGAGSLSGGAEVGNGIYTINIAAADMNGNTIMLRMTAATCDDTFISMATYP